LWLVLAETRLWLVLAETRLVFLYLPMLLWCEWDWASTAIF
jgi:hypothetical protein